MRSRIRNTVCTLGTIGLLSATGSSAGEGKELSDEAKRAHKAADVLVAAVSGEDAAIPQKLIDGAWGIAVVPHVVKGALGIGGRWGKGLVMQRSEDGGWSAPSYVSIGGASYGFQIGVEATDLVLVFTERDGLQALLDDHLKLGADAGVTAGPIGRKVEVGTNLTLDSAIYSYSRSKGLFAGVSLDGAILEVDHDSNAKVYGKKVKASAILAGEIGTPNEAEKFHETVTELFPVRDV